MGMMAAGGRNLVNTVVPLNASTPTLILAARYNPPFRGGFILQNNSSLDIWWSGNLAVSASGANQGFRLAAGATFPSSVSDVTIDGPIYAIAASATPSINVGEIV